MDCWSWADYVASLEGKGYNIRERWDSKGILHGYTLRKGNIIIKASELKGRAFTASRLEDTWRKLNTQKMSDVPTQRTVRTSRTTGAHAAGTTTPPPQPTAQSIPQQSNLVTSSTSQSSAPQVVDSVAQPPVPSPKQNYATLIDYTQYRTGTTAYTLEHDGHEIRCYIPEKVMDLFNDEFDYRETANWEELTNLAVALFIGMAGGPATVSSGGGGGSSTDNNWGRDKDEDDFYCAHAAVPKPHPKNSANNYADKIKNNFSFYTARHSWATAARNHQVPVSVISAGMGHTSERTTQIYLTMLENSLIDNANKGILESLRCIVSL